jgi:hypothetical protein
MSEKNSLKLMVLPKDNALSSDEYMQIRGQLENVLQGCDVAIMPVPVHLFQLVDGRWEPLVGVLEPEYLDDDNILTPIHEKAGDYEVTYWQHSRRVGDHWEVVEREPPGNKACDAQKVAFNRDMQAMLATARKRSNIEATCAVGLADSIEVAGEEVEFAADLKAMLAPTGASLCGTCGKALAECFNQHDSSSPVRTGHDSLASFAAAVLREPDPTVGTEMVCSPADAKPIKFREWI